MNWSKLKNNACPKCEKAFKDVAFSRRLGYIVCDCGFTISNRRFSEIVNSQVKERINEENYEA